MTTKADWPTDAAFGHAAWALDVDLAVVLAVAEVESSDRGAFDDDAENRPTILFERHYFHRLTEGRFDGARAPGVRPKVSLISEPQAGGYGLFREQWPKLLHAMTLDKDAALQSASWGAFQVMGANWQRTGASSLSDFVSRMYRSADDHLRAFVIFVLTDTRLLKAARELDWPSFARRYNGAGYSRNQYDVKLATAYTKHRDQLENGVTV